MVLRARDPCPNRPGIPSVREGARLFRENAAQADILQLVNADIELLHRGGTVGPDGLPASSLGNLAPLGMASHAPAGRMVDIVGGVLERLRDSIGWFQHSDLKQLLEATISECFGVARP